MNRKLVFLAAGIPVIGLMLLAGYRYGAGPDVPSDLRDAPGSAMEELEGFSGQQAEIPAVDGDLKAVSVDSRSRYGTTFGERGYPEVIGCVTLSRERYGVSGYFVLSVRKLSGDRFEAQVDTSRQSVHNEVLASIKDRPSDTFWPLLDASGEVEGFQGQWLIGTGNDVRIIGKFNYVRDAALPDYTDGITKRDAIRGAMQPGYVAEKLYRLEEAGGIVGHILPHHDQGALDFTRAVPIQCQVEKFEGKPYYAR